MINRIVQKGEFVSRVAAWISGAVLLATSVLITIEVILRKVFTVSMGGADEISSYAMAVSCSWAFAFALFKKAHIRIDVFYVKLPRIARRILDLVSLLLFGLYMSLLTYYSFAVFLTSFMRNSTANTPLHTPLWIPQLLWVMGLAGFTAAIFLLLTGTIYNLWKGSFAKAAELSGATTLEEEIEEGTVVSAEGMMDETGKAPAGAQGGAV